MKSAWRSYTEAKAFVQSLGFKNQQEWRDYCRSGQRPADIPSNPGEIYGEAFEGMGIWIGNRTRIVKKRPFLHARAFARSLKLSSGKAWEAYCRSGNKPNDIPADPRNAYPDEFVSMGDWLDTDSVACQYRTYRLFPEARAFVQTLGLRKEEDWIAYCRSGNKPDDIPAAPRHVYGSAFVSLGDWLGTGRVAPSQYSYRSFEDARAYARSLHLKSYEEWKTYCRSGQKPADIPTNPDRRYKPNFRSWGDWLATGNVANYTRTYRPFPEARTFVQVLGLKNEKQWRTYCRTGSKPADIPACPDQVYAPQFKNWGDWLGTGEVARSNRMYRSFPEARTFVQSLGLKNGQEWIAYCRSGNKPADIPTNPHQVYAPQFISMGDWLGSGSIASFKGVYRDFTIARAFVRTLGLKNQLEWQVYCRSGQKPADIPTNPHRTYRTEFRGFADWLGIVTKTWNRTTLLKLLESLRPHLRSLQERELYVILQKGGALPALQIALGETSTLPVLRRLLTQEEQCIQEIPLATDEDGTLLTTDEDGTLHDQKGELSHDEAIPERSNVNQQARMNSAFHDVSQRMSGSHLEASPILRTQRKEQLHLVDSLARLPGGLDDEAAEYLVSSRVSALWEIYSHEGWEAIDPILREEEGDQFFAEIKRRFLTEVEAVEGLNWTEGWAFTVNGKHASPNTMQRRIAWMVREYRRIGNWSGVGAGKTISALLSSRVIHASLTLIITNCPTISGWVQSIRNVYPESEVYTDAQAIPPSPVHQYRYLVLNYEKFQNAGRHRLVQHLLTLGIAFIVLDEIQLVKQRDKKISQRSNAVQTLIRKASQSNADLRVLGMSATPVINSLLEGKRLLEMTIGTSFPELETTPTIGNALAMHRSLMRYGFRFRPRYEQEMQIKLIPVKRNDLLPALEQAPLSVLAIEQRMLSAKLDALEPYLRPGTLLYTHYVEGILPCVQQRLSHLGFSMGFYTGSDKSGFQPFLQKQVDILLGSSAVGVGLDGLQQRCDQIIFLSLPWTSAAMEQIIGRARRQGSRFQEIEIIIPQIILEEDEETWSWDVQRWNLLQSKRTLSDCVLDGRIPEMIRLDEGTLLRQSYQALQNWITWVREKSAPHQSIPYTLPSPDDVA